MRTGFVVSERRRRVGVAFERDELGRVRADHHDGRILAPLERGKQSIEQLDSAEVVDGGDQRYWSDVDTEPGGRPGWITLRMPVCCAEWPVLVAAATNSGTLSSTS